MTTTSSTATGSSPTAPTLRGIGVGGGSAVGSVVKLGAAAKPPADEPAAADKAAADALVRSSFEYVATDLRARAAAAQAATAAVLELSLIHISEPTRRTPI